MLIEALTILVLSGAPAPCGVGGGVQTRVFVEFAEGEAVIDAEDGAVLDRIAALAAAQPNLFLDLHGFADRGDSPASADWRPEDVELAGRRSQAVATRLAGGGARPDQMAQEAHGQRAVGGDLRTDADGRERYTSGLVRVMQKSTPWTGTGPRPAC